MKRVLLLLLAAAILFPLLGVTAFYGYENWAGSVAWRQAEASLREAGEPLTIDALRPKPVRDADNMAAAPIFNQLFVFYNTRLAEVSNLRLPPPGPAAPTGDRSLLVALARRFKPDFEGSSAAASQVILDGIAPLEPLLDAVQAAASRPDAVWPVKYDRGFAAPMPFLPPLKHTSEVLAARAAVAVAEDRPADAISDMELITRLARDANQPSIMAGCTAEQTMLGYAVDIARDGLAQGIWSDDELTRIGRELADFRLLDSFCSSVRGERVLFLATPETLKARIDSVFTLQDFKMDDSAWLMGTLYRFAWNMRPSGWLDLDRASYSRFAQDWLGVVIHGDFVRPWALANWNAKLSTMRRNPAEFIRTPITALAVATFMPVARSAAYMQTRIDQARLACAIECYRRANGRLPADLAALAPHWIDRIPRDAITGSPYFYRVAGGNDYLLYGKGWNARDDGGSSANANGILGPSTADDWVWQVAPRWPRAVAR